MNTSTDMNFHLVKDDKELLEYVNNFFKTNGAIELTDMSGNSGYIIDGRNKKPQIDSVIQRIIEANHYVMPQAKNLKEESVIENVMLRYGMDMGLIGSKIVAYLIRCIVFDNVDANCQLKTLFLYAGEHFDMRYGQIERDVRYAVHCSYFSGTRIKSLLVIRMLSEAVREELIQKERFGRDIIENYNPEH